MKIFKTLLQMAMLSLVLVAITGCSHQNSKADINALKENIINVTLNSFEITSDTNVVQAGAVTFKATNIDVVTHEMLVIPVNIVKTKAKVDTFILPYDRMVSRVPEDEIESLGEVADIAGRTNGEVTLDLKPGTYMLICNLVAHYESGMRTLITVQ